MGKPSLWRRANQPPGSAPAIKSLCITFAMRVLDPFKEASEHSWLLCAKSGCHVHSDRRIRAHGYLHRRCCIYTIVKISD